MKYKLTDENDKTYNNTQWGENITHRAERGKAELCSSTVVHYYDHPLLAVLLDPANTNIPEPHLWEAKGRRVVHDGTKGGCKSLTTTKRIPLPEITTTQRVRFAILCALEVYHDARFKKWATRWLKDEDRSEAANRAAAAAAEAVVWAAVAAKATRATAATAKAAWAVKTAVAATDAAAKATCWAAETAVRATTAATAAAGAAKATRATAAAAAGAATAWAAAWAAKTATRAAVPTHRLAKLAEQAIREE
uniref:Uncharacterized protein n=1 Tax=viral metagenome TaxID=1070528 RepID=A0A6M3L734_9ZZZZ